MEPIRYPATRTVEHFDDYHGTIVADPYRWLEDLDSADTAEWVTRQNAVTFSYLDTIPLREPLRARLTELWDYEKFSQPFKEGGRYFYFRNDGLQNQFVLYTVDSLDADARVLLDPNTLSEDGTVALSGFAVSEDGRMLAYGLSTAGSDWQEWKVRDIQTGEDLEDHLRWIKFSAAAWTKDSKGFFYSRYAEPADGEGKLEDTNYFQKLYYHRIGSPQSDDVLVYERADQKEWGFGSTVTEDGRYLVITIWRGTEPKYSVFYKDLDDPDAKIVELLPDFEARYEFVGNDGTTFWFLTDLDAPRGKLIAIDNARPAIRTEVIAESEQTLEWVSAKRDRFLAGYLTDACSDIRIFSLEGARIGTVSLPGPGTVLGFGGKRDDDETFFTFTSFLDPATIYRYSVARDESAVFRRSQMDFDADAFVTEQVFYPSKDGTKIPMFITHRKGIVLDGSNPAFLYGYGGFNISMTPAFSIGMTAWMERGGIYAVANLRGGGEYGEEWHQAGCKHNKQNVFDDFIAAAEWLIETGYTSTPKLAISGGSNGGLLTGACLTQRPDLFGAVHIAVGVLDMLRFHKFTIGWGWVSDYGSADDPAEFKTLYAYSPLHNVKPAQYPAVIVTTADHDDRVVPSHSFKFISTLQKEQSGPAPVLIRVDVKAGHGMGKPTTKVIEESADRFAFLLRALDADQ